MHLLPLSTDCGEPKSKDQAKRSYNSTAAGSQAVYSCHHGYSFTSHDQQLTVECGEGGNWSYTQLDDTSCVPGTYDEYGILPEYRQQNRTVKF